MRACARGRGVRTLEVMNHVGIGYDVHQLVSGRRLVLGGVEIPHDKGLDGHSDADALLHAIVDAIEATSWAKDVWLFTGDGDFTYLVNKLKRVGTHVTVVSSTKTKPPMIADELRRSADKFRELDELIQSLAEPILKEKSRWA